MLKLNRLKIIRGRPPHHHAFRMRADYLYFSSGLSTGMQSWSADFKNLLILILTANDATFAHGKTECRPDAAIQQSSVVFSLIQPASFNGQPVFDSRTFTKAPTRLPCREYRKCTSLKTEYMIDYTSQVSRRWQTAVYKIYSRGFSDYPRDMPVYPLIQIQCDYK